GLSRSRYRSKRFRRKRRRVWFDTPFAIATSAASQPRPPPPSTISNSRIGMGGGGAGTGLLRTAPTPVPTPKETPTPKPYRSKSPALTGGVFENAVQITLLRLVTIHPAFTRLHAQSRLAYNLVPCSELFSCSLPSPRLLLRSRQP